MIETILYADTESVSDIMQDGRTRIVCECSVKYQNSEPIISLAFKNQINNVIDEALSNAYKLSKI